MSNEKVACVACGHDIDATAKLCPFCGANPITGEKVDPRPVLESHFSRKETLTPTEGALQFVRDRQAIVVTAGVVLVLVVFFGVSRVMQARNANAVADVPAVPLTEVTDLSNQAADERPVEMPELEFEYEGNPDTLRTLLMEPGAIAPPAPATETAAATSPATGAPAQRTGSAAPAVRRPVASPAQQPRPPAPAQQRPAVTPRPQ